MGFRTPSFNLRCRIWSRSSVPPGLINPATLGPPRLDSDCQLRGPGKQSSAQDQNAEWYFSPLLLLPAGTDIRDNFAGTLALPFTRQPDLVEVPVGSGHWYSVVYADDVAKGFPNEYRFATMFKQPPWPIPFT